MSEDPRTYRALELVHELSDPGAGSPGLETRLVDLGFDSLAFAELALALEEETGIDLGEAVLDGGPARSVPESSSGVGRFQGVGNLVAGRAMRWWLALEVVGIEHVPERGPAVLAMNHESALDIPIAVIACPRRITFMAKKELFKDGVAAWALERLGGFRVDRERFDLRAVHLALAVIRRGKVLGSTRRAPVRPASSSRSWTARRGSPYGPALRSCPSRSAAPSRPDTRSGQRRIRVRATFGEPLEIERVESRAERRRRAAELTAELRAAVEAGLSR